MTCVSELQIKENTIISRLRVLIFPGKVLAEIGQQVQPDTIVAKTELLPGMPVAIDLASFFGITPDQVSATLRKNVGDRLEVGDRLAVMENSLLEGGKRIYASPHRGLVEHISLSRGLVLVREESSIDEPVIVVDVAKELKISPRFLRTFCHVREGEEVALGSILASIDGVGGEAVRSPMRGTVSNIDTRSGTISLMKPYSPSYAKAYLSGRVMEIVPERGVVVEATGTYVEGVFGVGGEQFGILTQVTDRQDEEVDACHITKAHEGAVIFGGTGITRAGMEAALEHKVSGVLVGGLRSSDLVALLGREISTGITGQEGIITTFIATEGFGSVPMLESIYRLLQKYTGRTASINGRTQIRAGVQRPEIIISHPVPQIEGNACASVGPPRLRVGSLVRAIIDPYFGQAGEIVDILPPQRLPTEAEMPLLLVKLLDGRMVKLLLNNVERMRR